MNDPATDTRRRALGHLQHFLSGALPTLLRQLNCWNGLNAAMHGDVVEDLLQELSVDCLEHAPAIATMPLRERHTRWFRLVEQAHYRLRLRGQRHAPPESMRWVPEPGSEPAPELPLDQLSRIHRDTLRRLPAAARYLRNGRLNIDGTSKALRMRPQVLRSLWASVAEQLGYDDEFLAFWRRRLVEALVGLAADLLRDSGHLRIHDEPSRARPDPAGRIKRLRRIRRRVSVRPVPADMRRALTRFGNAATASRLTAMEILELAAGVDPEDQAVHLWQFEAAVAAGELRVAARALAAARRTGAQPVRVTLARARLREARGREAQARDLLVRAAAKRPDPRLAAALRDLCG